MVLAADQPAVVVRQPAFRALLFSTLLWNTATSATAQDLTRQLAACVAVSDATQRLACYDALALPRQPPAPPQASTPPQSPAVLQPPTAQFGAEQLPRASNSAPAPENNSITATVNQISLTPFGRFVLTLDNGQIWRQLDADSAQFATPGNKATASVTISRGLLGSYNLQFAGQNALYKVRRVK